MSPPVLCVVTVTYDDPAGLRRTIESLRPLSAAWPAPDWEHVVVDAAPSRSRPVLQGLAADWPLVHLERPPRGVADAFNQALEVATRCEYLWFLNGGDALRDLVALSRMLATLDRDRSVDLVCGGAYLHRHDRALYPLRPRSTLLGNIVGRSWMYQQAVIYRRSSLRRVGKFSTAYHVSADYDYHIRCYIAGLSGRFARDLLVDYDMEGGSNDPVVAFAEFKRIQRSHRSALPAWVNGLNEVVRTVEYGRIMAFRTLAATRVGGRLRPAWAKLNRWLRPRGVPPAF